MGALRILRVDEAPAEAWDSAWEHSPAATWFQSRAWAEAWSQGSSGTLRPVALQLEFSDGVTMRVPLVVQRGRFRRHVATLASPGGTAGGWIPDASLEKSHAELGAAWLLAQPGLDWRVNPFDPLAHTPLESRGAREDPSWVLNLDAGFDTLLRGFSKGHRAAARRAEREGVDIAVAQSDAEWEAYLAAYRESVARWGPRARGVHPDALFQRLRERSGERLRLWTARRAGELLAGAVVFDAPAHQVYWHGAARAAALHCGAVHLLLRSAIENACAEGAPAFDFNPSGGLEGVSAFKRGFGAQARPSPILRTAPGGLGATIRRWFGGRVDPT